MVCAAIRHIEISRNNKHDYEYSLLTYGLVVDMRQNMTTKLSQCGILYR